MNALDAFAAKLGDRYRIERELGRGGMGAVYLARDVRLERHVALKVLPEEFATQVALRERFLRETRTAASFSHPNVVPVYAVEETDDVLAYAMAFVEGESLAERVKRAGPLSVRDAVKLLQDVGYALAYAHGRGVVHRDIKPDNIMIERATGRALVMDFGIARLITAPVAAGAEGLTRVGEVVGTPEYMSPEQATGDHVDGRSDLYSLGLVAFFALTGRPAITGDTTGRMLARQITEALPPIRDARSDVPAPLADAIEKCAAKNPDERFANAESLVEALDATQLAGPVIPVAIRVFAQELSTLSLVLIGGAVMLFFLVRQFFLPIDLGPADLMLPVALLTSVLLTRIMQTGREARRTAAIGFTADEILRGLREVVDEREARRDELRADPLTRRARRRTVIAAFAQIAGAVLMARVAMASRTPRPGGYITPPWATVLFFSAIIMLGVSVALLMRSPFRMPIGERLFRLVWLGPVGRGFMRFAARSSRQKGGAVVSTSPTVERKAPVTQPVSIPATAQPQLAALESRVAELERWRKESRV
jgi:serine/threonine-protein kinase